MSDRQPLGLVVERAVRLPRVEPLIRDLAARCTPGAVALDLGCGAHSGLRNLAPNLTVIGVDTHAESLEQAKARGTHDLYVQADILVEPSQITEALAGAPVELVVLLHLIEHVPKRDGYELLERAEALTSRFVVVETPNGFQPQGPEYGNEAQRHRSGWFPHDFVGRGYSVRGTAGTRYLRGYAGRPRLPIRGGESADFLLARALWIERFPRHAYTITAWKDVQGVEARLG